MRCSGTPEVVPGQVLTEELQMIQLAAVAAAEVGADEVVLAVDAVAVALIQGL